LYVALEVTVMKQVEPKRERNALKLAVALGLFPRSRKADPHKRKRAKDAKHHWSRDQW
jgi:hypothetical protein